MGGDPGPDAAIRAAGAARSTWRPDLYAEANGAIDDTAVARAQEYALLAALLAHPPDTALLQRLACLQTDGTTLGAAHEALGSAAVRTDPVAVESEYFDLFIGVGRGALLPYASYYLTGFLHDRPLARLRADLEQFGIERAPGRSEPEDHAATLCEIMAGLASGEFAAPIDRQRQFFEGHLAPWIGRFFADLESAERATFYRTIGTIGRLFVTIETEAFALPA